MIQNDTFCIKLKTNITQHLRVTEHHLPVSKTCMMYEICLNYEFKEKITAEIKQHTVN